MKENEILMYVTEDGAVKIGYGCQWIDGRTVSAG